MLVVLGTCALITGLRSTFLGSNLADFSEWVGGRLDAYLLQLVFRGLLAISTPDAPLALIQSVLGLGVIAVGLRELNHVPTLGGIAGWEPLSLRAW